MDRFAPILSDSNFTNSNFSHASVNAGVIQTGETGPLRIRLVTLFLVIVPVAVFFAGVSRTHVVTIHVGMSLDEVARILRSASAVEISRPLGYSRVQTQGSPEYSTYWQLPHSKLTIETVALDDEILNGLYLDASSTKKLIVHDRGLQIDTLNELTEDEIAKGRRNSPPHGFKL